LSDGSDGEDDKPEDGEAEISNSLEVGRIVPIYETAMQGKLSSRWFRRILRGVLQSLPKELPDAIPAVVRQRMNLLPLSRRFGRFTGRTGESFEALQKARTPAHIRLIFEELFFVELGSSSSAPAEGSNRNCLSPGRRGARCHQTCPAFHPQTRKSVCWVRSPPTWPTHPMRRLLQGDVGSGKTIVALQAAIVAIESGYQVALMAPTEILATQHYLSARRILEPLGTASSAHRFPRR